MGPIGFYIVGLGLEIGQWKICIVSACERCIVAVRAFWNSGMMGGGGGSLVLKSWLTRPPTPPLQTSSPPTHPSNPSCREVLKNTVWQQIREHWQMSGSLFFWVKTEQGETKSLLMKKERFRRTLWEHWNRKAKQLRVPREERWEDSQMKWFQKGQ